MRIVASVMPSRVLSSIHSPAERKGVSQNAGAQLPLTSAMGSVFRSFVTRRRRAVIAPHRPETRAEPEDPEDEYDPGNIAASACKSCTQLVSAYRLSRHNFGSSGILWALLIFTMNLREDMYLCRHPAEGREPRTTIAECVSRLQV